MHEDNIYQIFGMGGEGVSSSLRKNGQYEYCFFSTSFEEGGGPPLVRILLTPSFTCVQQTVF